MDKYLGSVRIPKGGDKVYKDESTYCFDCPESAEGLYICLKTWQGVGKKHVERHFTKTGSGIYLHMRTLRKEIPKTEEELEKKEVKRMAIGVSGGFDVSKVKYEFEDRHSLVVLPEWKVVSLDDPSNPTVVQQAVAAVLAADSAARQEELQQLQNTWDGELRVVSKHADNLVQLDNGKIPPPSGWQCEKCDKTDNLWLNLSDGSILCGRMFFDGTGGNNHAEEHYAHSKFPLAVKLGTITPDGADVYSYDEDDMVQDPHLAKHLAHWGINVAGMQKTDKTMAELEIDLNLNQRVAEWDEIQEAGEDLETAYGPGYTGIVNLGNSCYMNSVLQTLFLIPDFSRRFYSTYEATCDSAPSDPTKDFNMQMSKVAHGLLSGEYSKPQVALVTHVVEPHGIKPQMFKALVGANHPEFATKRQQDALEYLTHLLGFVERNSRPPLENPVDCVRFTTEDRVQCAASGHVRYTSRDDLVLQLPVDLADMSNGTEYAGFQQRKAAAEKDGQMLPPGEVVRPKISLLKCIERYAAEETISDFYSSAIRAKTSAHKRTFMKTFPDFLFINLRKFIVSPNWTPAKLDVSIDVPDEMDLGMLRGRGQQPGEQLLPDESAAPTPVEYNAAAMAGLLVMGFSENSCKRALFHTQNAGLEQAKDWLMSHLDDADLHTEFVPPGAAGGGGARQQAQAEVSEENIMMMQTLGFSRQMAVKALRQTNNSLERASDRAFSHMDELDAPDAPAAPTKNVRDGSSRYRLVGFISHMGTSCQVGHYVCHLKRDNRWVIYNDEKVAFSKRPPTDLAYIYLYQRC